MRIDMVDDLVKKNWLCSLATTNGQTPHCSLMVYIADDSLRNLYMVTMPDSIKFNNIQVNPNVSILIDNRNDPQKDPRPTYALTIFGKARIVENDNFSKEIKERILSLHSFLQPLASNPSARVIEVQLQSVIVSTGPSEADHLNLQTP